MLWNDLEPKGKAPESGWILAYTRKKVIFHTYENLSALEEELNGEELLELHLFDDEKEYRCLATRSKRFSKSGKSVETAADAQENQKKTSSGMIEPVVDVQGKKKKTFSGIIETVVDFPEEDGTTVYKEKVLLDKTMISGGAQIPEKITVLNHIRYTENNGMAVIDNYRLKI